MIHLTINRIPVVVEEETTVLHAARQAGITIPTLCDHPDLSPYGGCRLCLVEVKGARFPATACTLLASEGMQVTTESPTLTRHRRGLLELMLHRYHDSGYKKDKVETELQHWAKRYRVSIKQKSAPAPSFPVDSDPNPFVWVDLNKCILCNRCVRACAEVQGRFVWNVIGRGAQAHVTPGAGDELIAARCESCGACVAYCPTGALDYKPSISIRPPERKVTTTCTYCGVGCQLDLNVRDNQVVRVTSNPAAPINGNHLCVKGRFGYEFIHHPERLLRPRLRRYLLDGAPKPPGRGEWVEVDWDTALGITARKLAQARRAHGPQSIAFLTSAKCTNEENYLMNKLARQVVGTNSIDHCARL